MSTRVRQATSVTDRIAASEIMRQAFDTKAPLLSVAARRLRSVRRLDADWWLLEHAGIPVATLLCYPLSFGLPDGSVRPGFGFGAVATLAEHRRRGHAARLCAEVTQDCERHGRGLGLLYSAIAPAYYERLGWRTCPAWDFLTTRLRGLADSGERAELVALDPRRSIDELTRLYQERHHGQLHLHRDAARFAKSLAREPDDWWLGVGDPDGELRAGVRLGQQGRVLDLIELLAPDDQVPAILRSLAALGLELDCEKLGCWLPRSEFVAQWFEETGRAKTLPMVLGIPELGDSQFWASDYF